MCTSPTLHSIHKRLQIGSVFAIHTVLKVLGNDYVVALDLTQHRTICPVIIGTAKSGGISRSIGCLAAIRGTRKSNVLSTKYR